MSYLNPLRSPIHVQGWRRPAGNTDFVITRGFGDRSVEVNGTWPPHNGVDIANGRSGAPVQAIGPGKVTFAAPDPFSGGARIVIVQLDSGLRQWAAHLGSFSVVAGERIAAGHQLGTLDTSGWATGPHLHHQLQKRNLLGGWTNIDPAPYLHLVEHQLPDTAVKLRAVAYPPSITGFRIQGGTKTIIGRKTVDVSRASGSYVGTAVEGLPGYYYIVEPATAPLLHYYLIEGLSGRFTVQPA